MKRMLCALLVFCLLLPFGGCGRKEPLEKTDFLMDTVCTLTLYEGGDETVLNGAFDLCREYEALLSKTVEGSDVSRVNEAEDGTVAVDPRTADLLRTALSYTALTDGKFDVTVGRLTELWDFRTETPAVPEEAALKEAVAHTGAGHLTVEGNDVTVSDGVRLDLGGIAKGYIADRCADYLREHGVTRAVIDFGGNIVVVGEKADGVPWTVGIRRPFAESSEIVGSVRLADCAAVTSGIYERSFEKDGTLYHHILDPQTGLPVSNGLESVTIFAKSSTDADALSTSAFLLGKEKALALVESLPDVEAILIDSEGELFATSGIGKTIPFERS